MARVTTLREMNWKRHIIYPQGANAASHSESELPLRPNGKLTLQHYSFSFSPLTPGINNQLSLFLYVPPPGPTVGLYRKTHWKKYTSFTFGLDARTLLREKKKSSHLDQLSLNEAGESNEQNQLLPCMHLLQRLWVTEVFLWRQQGQNTTALNQILSERLPTPNPWQWSSLQLGSCTDCCSHFLSAEFVSSTQEWPVIFPWPGSWGYAVASFEGLWVSSLDRTVSVRSALTQHAPGCYGNYLPSQNVPEHCSELPGAPAWIGCRKPQFTSSS